MRWKRLLPLAVAGLLLLMLVTPASTTSIFGFAITGAGEGWYGIGEDYVLWAPEQGKNYVAEWNTLLDDPRFTKWGFNVIRLSFKFGNIGPNPLGWHDHTNLDYTMLDNVLDILDSRGIRVIMVDHSWAEFGSQKWVDNWVDFSNRFKGDSRIVAYHIRDEIGSWTWGSNIQSQTDVLYALVACTDTIRAIESDRTIIWSDPVAYYDLARTIPQDAQRPNVIYDFHSWYEGGDVGGGIDKAQREATYMSQYQPYGEVMCVFGVWSQYDWLGQKAHGVEIVNRCLALDAKGFILFYWHHWSCEDEFDEILEASDFGGGSPIPPPPPSPGTEETGEEAGSRRTYGDVFLDWLRTSLDWASDWIQAQYRRWLV